MTVSPALVPEVVQAASLVPTTTRSADPSASLSLVALGTDKAVPIALTATSSARTTSTTVLDELYRRLNFLGALPVNGINVGVGGNDNTDELLDVWGLEGIPADVDTRENSDD